MNASGIVAGVSLGGMMGVLEWQDRSSSDRIRCLVYADTAGMMTYLAGIRRYVLEDG